MSPIPVGINRVGEAQQVGKEWGYESFITSSDETEAELAYYWLLRNKNGELVNVQTGMKFLTTVETVGQYRLDLTVLDTVQNRIQEMPIPVDISEPNQSPRAKLSTDRSQLNVGQPLTFDASSSTDPDGEISEYNWAIYHILDADGNPVDGQAGKRIIDETTGTATFTHDFDQRGQYWARVTVVDDDGASSSSDSVGFRVR